MFGNVTKKCEIIFGNITKKVYLCIFEFIRICFIEELYFHYENGLKVRTESHLYCVEQDRSEKRQL